MATCLQVRVTCSINKRDFPKGGGAGLFFNGLFPLPEPLQHLASLACSPYILLGPEMGLEACTVNVLQSVETDIEPRTHGGELQCCNCLSHGHLNLTLYGSR